MGIKCANIPWYQCLYFGEAQGDDMGGDIDTSSPITDNSDNNYFDTDIAGAEAAEGHTDYTKVFARNETGNDWYTNAKTWISQLTLAGDEIWIGCGGFYSKLGVDVDTGLPANFNCSVKTQIYVNLPDMTIALYFGRSESVYRKGDTHDKATAISYFGSQNITLKSAYPGTCGDGNIMVASVVDNFDWKQPTTWSAGLHRGNTNSGMRNGDRWGLWIKRVVPPGTTPYAGNSFKLTISDG